MKTSIILLLITLQNDTKFIMIGPFVPELQLTALDTTKQAIVASGLPQPGPDDDQDGYHSHEVSTTDQKRHQHEVSQDDAHTHEENLKTQKSQKPASAFGLGGRETDTETVKETTDTDTSDRREKDVDSHAVTKDEKRYDESADGNHVSQDESHDKVNTTRVRTDQEKRENVTKTTEIERERDTQAVGGLGLVSVDQKHKQKIKKVNKKHKVKKSSNDTTIVEKSHAANGSALHCDDDGSCDTDGYEEGGESKDSKSTGADDSYYDETEEVSEKNTDQTSVTALGMEIPVSSSSSDGAKKDKPSGSPIGGLTPGVTHGLPTAGLTSGLGL